MTTEGWQTIGNAPKDGRRVLIYGRGRGGPIVTIGRWHQPANTASAGDWICAHAVYDATHFMELPAPPKVD